MPLTYATAHEYLLQLGRRFAPIGRAQLSYDGLLVDAEYPLLVVEGDSQGSDVLREGSQPTGVESFTVAVQVLTMPERADATLLPAMLAETKGWAEALNEQLRQEHAGCLLNVGWLALPGVAGTDLATGWRVELTLKLRKDIDRTVSAALFTPA